MKLIAPLLGSLLLALSTSSCSYVGNLLNAPGRLINGVLGPVIPPIPTGAVDGDSREGPADPMAPTPALAGEQTGLVAAAGEMPATESGDRLPL